MPDRDTSQRLRALADRIDALGRASLEPWLTAGLDPHGGAPGFLDRKFQRVVDPEDRPRGPGGQVRGDQGLVQQARHLFAYSLMHERRPGDPRVTAAAHALYEHLERRFSRGPGSPYVHQLSATYAVRSDVVQLYAQGFAVFALSTYARIFDQARAATQARQLFTTLDALRHDDELRGYDQTNDDGWLPFVFAPEGAAKCTNTHIHVLEALTALVRTPARDALSIRRLEELAQAIVTKMLQPSGYVHPFFARDWTPVGPTVVSYGHDIETSWLLLDALEALDAAGQTNEATRELVTHGARRMAEHALRAGWDPAGGLFDHGVPEGPGRVSQVTCAEKIWWAQAEALPGIYRLYRLTKDPTLVDRLEQTLSFFESKSWDPEYGGFFWGVDSNGLVLGRGDHKGELWKTPYHGLRACLLTSDWIRQHL
jgi:mannobiose 2-epimerase